MKNRRIPNPAESPFLGILEGKRKKAIADAAIKLEEERRKTFLAQKEAALQGYDPERTKQEQAIKLEETNKGIDPKLYMTIGLIVVVVMVALYFIKKRS